MCKNPITGSAHPTLVLLEGRRAEPARSSPTCTKVMYTLSTSGRSSRSTFMHTKFSFIIAPISLFWKDSSSITWHQWQVEYPTASKPTRSGEAPGGVAQRRARLLRAPTNCRGRKTSCKHRPHVPPAPKLRTEVAKRPLHAASIQPGP